MTSVFQLYGRPFAGDTPLPPLSIEGDLVGYQTGEAYEGRLQIVNAIGKSTVEIVESDLPPGAYAFVDQFTKEIVLRWPAYTSPENLATGVPNGDFEFGDDGSWRKGAGWSIEAGGAETGTYSAVFANQRGIYSIESQRVPYTPGTSITASARFQQGASSSGNLAGRVILVWCDANGNMLPGGEGASYSGGNLIKSGSGGAWYTSTVTASSASAATVAIGFSANRKKQNKSARVDNFTWNHTYSVGTIEEFDYSVTFKVTDSANRVAYWSGIVPEWSDPYWDHVVALVPFDNLKSPHDVAFVDYTGRGWYGSTQNAKRTSAFSPFGRGSMDVSSGLYPYTRDSSAWDLGTAPFTMEALVKWDAVTDCGIITHWSGMGGNQAWALWYFGGNFIWRISTASNVYNDVQVPFTFVAGTTYYLAIDRNASGLVRLYVNGAVVASASQTSNHLPCNAALRIGSVGGFSLDMDGHVSWVRITKGIARWNGVAPEQPPYAKGSPTPPFLQGPYAMMETV